MPLESHTPPDFHIDTPRPADAPALARLHVRGWEVAYGNLISGDQWFGPEAIERRTAQWTAWLSPDRTGDSLGVYRIGRDREDTPIGFAVSWPPSDPEPVRERELSLLYIDEAWFGSGLGRALVEAVIGDEPASVWVAEENPRAQRFYEKLGFVADGATQVEDHLAGIRDLRMVR